MFLKSAVRLYLYVGILKKNCLHIHPVKDGYRLKLEKVGQKFSSFTAMPEKINQKHIMVSASWLRLFQLICSS